MRALTLALSQRERGPAVHRVKQGRTDRRQYDNVHRAILAGLLSSVALRGDGYEYSVAGGGKGHIWPGSGVFAQRPKWLVAAEVVETTRRYLRTCGRIDPQWIEPIAAHVVKRSYHGVHWAPAHASAMALERVTLFGLTIVAGRRVHYGPIDPTTSRHLLIEQGLVEGHIEPKPAFLVENEGLVAELERLAGKAAAPRPAGKRFRPLRVLRPPRAGRGLRRRHAGQVAPGQSARLDDDQVRPAARRDSASSTRSGSPTR